MMLEGLLLLTRERMYHDVLNFVRELAPLIVAINVLSRGLLFIARQIVGILVLVMMARVDIRLLVRMSLFHCLTLTRMQHQPLQKGL
jgi:hypothetical protein